jgi:hypothetical protein
MIRDIARWIKHRLLFEIRGTLGLLHSDDNTKRLKQLKGTAQNNRCFIVATGPSLTIEDVEKLSDEVTFGLNSIFLIYDKTNWRPTEYVCTDDGYFKKVFEEYKFSPAELGQNNVFLNIKNRDLVGENHKLKYIKFSQWNRATDFRWPFFQKNIVRGMYAFGTVTNIAMGIAIYMGYKEIYLIGTDCTNLNRHIVNDVTDSHKSDDKADEIARIQLKGYKAMKKVADKYGIKIFNATRGGALEVFERVDLDSVLEK